MAYAHVVDVAAPVEMYDALHAEITAASAGSVPGLLVHVGRATPAGFQVLEVWESAEHFERHDADVVLPAMQRLSAGAPGPAPRQAVQTFEVHGLVVPGGAVLV